ncbi:MAG TPA: transposase, partial [Caldilineaceae bacterium]|nr:transposase [Caldilineaceae bacterium]
MAAIRVLNRLELVGETLRAALNELATVGPDWLRSVAPPAWYERYRRRIEADRLPQSEEKRAAYAQTLDEDGFLLLDRLAAADVPVASRTLPTVETLRLVLARHYERVSGAQDGQRIEQIRFKESGELPPAAEGIESPYDLDARYRSRQGTAWTGYLVHLSETCETDEVHLITHVETTQATVHESQRTAAIHQALVAKHLPPGEHFVDAAYVDAELLVESQQQYGIDLCGPTRPNPSWQTQVEGAYTLDQFAIDWDHQEVRCPQGKVATAWKEGLDSTGQPIIYVGFRIKDCQACAARARCTRGRYRHLHLKPRIQFELLQPARQRFATA